MSMNHPENDTNNLILQELLQGQRDIRQVVSELAANTSTKTDLTDIRVDMKVGFEKIDYIIKNHDGAIAMLKLENAANTNFRKGIYSSVRYALGAVFVAALGVLASVLPGMLNHPLQNPAVAAISSPTPTSLPIHIHFPPKE